MSEKMKIPYEEFMCCEDKSLIQIGTSTAGDVEWCQNCGTVVSENPYLKNDIGYNVDYPTKVKNNENKRFTR